MGVLNRTPDSFSDGGLFLDDSAALRHVELLRGEGADVLDIGAESTRPGSASIAPSEQIKRLGGVLREAAARIPIVSIDTTSVEVAEYALGEGATVVNSVSLEPAAELGALCARHGAALVLMHSRGPMAAMPGFSMVDDAAYGDVVADVAREWSAAAERALDAGLPPSELLFDPGLGFAKNARHSLELCARLEELCALGFPVVVGASRKSFLAKAAALYAAGQKEGEPAPQAPPEARLGGTIAATLACIERGASVVRVHDVAQVRQAIAVFEMINGRGLARPDSEASAGGSVASAAGGSEGRAGA
jgi:dihydropteroate synthase